MTVTTDAQTLFVCLDCTVNIPSNLRVSALNAQEVIWFRIKESVTEQVENAQINPDYSLTLTHVRRSDDATYFAQATNTDGASMNSPQVDLMVIEKPGEKFYCHYFECSLFQETINVDLRNLFTQYCFQTIAESFIDSFKTV